MLFSYLSSYQSFVVKTMTNELSGLEETFPHGRRSRRNCQLVSPHMFPSNLWMEAAVTF